MKYLVHVAETVGEEWLQPHLFRFGASSLLNDVLLQRQKLTTGHYSGPRLRHHRLTEDHAWDSWNTRPRPSRGASST